MRLVFIYGPAASGKLTIARQLCARADLALFHNHLVVDAVLAVFPFGSEPFVRLRDQFWIATFEAAVKTGRSLVFTFAPEPSVAPDFPERVRGLVTNGGGEVAFIRLTLDEAVQERRLVEPDRAAFGKLRSVEFVRQMRESFAACESAMPPADLTIDTGVVSAAEAADTIVERLAL